MGISLNQIWTSFRESFSFLFAYWKLVAVIYLAQLFLAFLAVAPLNWLLKHAFGESLNLKDISGTFNYTYVMEFLREYNVSVAAFINHSIVVILVFILWLIFINGGIVRALFVPRSEWTLSVFWKNCSTYFSKFLVLHFYIFLATGVVAYILFRIFMKDGINPFHFETEQILIDRFWILMVLFAVLMFILSLFKDVSKIYIVKHERSVHSAMAASLKSFLAPEVIALALLHLSWILLISILYFALRKNADLVSWTMIIIGQAYLLMRIAYRILRISAFKNHFDIRDDAPVVMDNK